MRTRSAARCVVPGALILAFAGCASAPPPPVAAPPPPGPVSSPPPPRAASVVVLLPDDASQTGRLTVSGPGGTQVLTLPGEALRIPRGESAPSAPFVMPQEEVTRLFGSALAAQPGPPARFLIYFDGNSDKLTAESQARLGEVVRAIAERRAVDISVAGHTDTVGPREYNFRLGRRRAMRVYDALTALKVDPGILRVESHGKDLPLIRTGDNVAEPRNRRVEVTVR